VHQDSGGGRGSEAKWQGRSRFEKLTCGFGCPGDVRISPHFRRVSLDVFKRINLSEGFVVSVRRFAATATLSVRTLRSAAGSKGGGRKRRDKRLDNTCADLLAKYARDAGARPNLLQQQ
jgi:hypothetical protein